MTKSSRLRASLPRSTRTPLCELPAGRTRCPSRALAWYRPTMPCTWHAVNEAILAMTSLATLTEPRGRSGIGLDPLHVGAGAGIDPDDVALVDKERPIQDQPGLHRGRLAAAGRRVAPEAGRRLRDFPVDRGGQLGAHATERAPGGEKPGGDHRGERVVPRGGLSHPPGHGRAPIWPKIAEGGCGGGGPVLGSGPPPRPADSSSMSPKPQVRPQSPWKVVRSWIRSMAIERENLETIPSLRMTRWSVSTYSCARQPQ